MRICTAPWSIAALGAAVLLSGCVGKPQTFYVARPIVLERPTAVRMSPKPVPASLPPALSASEKQRLFQDFQQSQGLTSRTVTTQEPVP